MTHSVLHLWAASTPRWFRGYTDCVVGALGHERRLRRVLSRCAVPTMLVDGDRRLVDANPAARLAIRLPLSDLRALRVDDLTPEPARADLLAAWRQLTEDGLAGGSHVVSPPGGCRLEVMYHALARVLPDAHLVAFTPSGWPEDELAREAGSGDALLRAPLTQRELEVLELAADGCTGPMIAERLALSGATVRTHFEHIYAKLLVRDRAAAVAKAMRLGMIG